MRRRPGLWEMVGGCLACWGLMLGGCAPTALGPTRPSGYQVFMPEASQTLRFQPLALTVRVQDASGQPVDEVAVRFRVPETWTTQAEVNPPTVVTRQGQATTTFRARVAGHMMVEVTVEDHTSTVPVVVLGEVPRF